MDRVYINGLLNQLEKEIDKVNGSESTNMVKYHDALVHCKNAQFILKEYILRVGFTLELDEIEFFKDIKPKFVSRGIYYAKLYQIESSFPPVSKKMRIVLLKDEVRKLDNFASNNSEFWRYYRTDSKHNDSNYFKRLSKQLSLPITVSMLDVDYSYTSSHSLIVARFKANVLIAQYLENHINKLSGKSVLPTESSSKLNWNSSKTDLVELIYALVEAQVIQGDIKLISTKLGEVFDIDISEIYKTWGDIKNRKKDKTKFINGLASVLLKKIESIYD